MIVVDASVLVTALADDGDDGARARSRLDGEELAAPHLVDVEVLSAWRRLRTAGHLDDRRASLAVQDLRDLPIGRVAPVELLERCWELRSAVTIADAMYVALAELLDVPLLTADARLGRANGPRCVIEVLS